MSIVRVAVAICAGIRESISDIGRCKSDGMTTNKISYTKGYKYQLEEPYQAMIPIKPDYDIFTDFAVLYKDGKLTIFKHYAWDGPSGPTIDSPVFMRASLVHDVLYQFMRQGLLPSTFRHDADELLRTMCLEDGMWRIRAWYVYHFVRLCAGPCADPSHKKVVFTAP